ncbi:MAG: oxalurate catabolism protein HpxZ [Alphaproteobacteria bacterium]|nr:MAG: oxalurate catabolism protein HpxZ [Alphaproteobacteria bacterium]
MSFDINIPEIVAEVTQAHERYERALSTNDLDVLDSLFWDSERTLRYGPNGTLVGHAAISAFRRARRIKGVERTVLNTRVTTFGRDFAVTNSESKRPGAAARGRQSQTWVRMPEGWRIVSAHVSDEPAP